MADRSNSTRRDIITLLRSCVQKNRSANQQLADLVIPEDAYHMGKAIVQRDTFEIRYYHVKVFTILLDLCNEVTLSQGKETVKAWQKGLKALLRYINNLLLAPNRPELKTVKVGTSYFHFQVKKYLKEAESYLNIVGYQRIPNSTDLTLRNFSIDHAYQLVADIIVLHEDLEVVHFLLTRTDVIPTTLHKRNIEFKHVLLARQYGPPAQKECLDFIMDGKADFSPPSEPVVNYTSGDYFDDGRSNFDQRFNDTKSNYDQRYDDTRSCYGQKYNNTRSNNGQQYRDEGYSDTTSTYHDTRSDYDQRHHDTRSDYDQGYSDTRSDYNQGSNNSRISHDGAGYREENNYEERRPQYNYQRSRSYDYDQYRDQIEYTNQYGNQYSDQYSDRYSNDTQCTYRYNESPQHNNDQHPLERQNTSTSNTSFDLSSSFSSTSNMPPPMMDAQQLALQMRKYNKQSSTPLPDVKTGQIETPNRTNSQESTSFKYGRRASSTPSVPSESSFEMSRYAGLREGTTTVVHFSPEPIPENEIPPSFRIGDKEDTRPSLTKGTNFDDTSFDQGPYNRHGNYQIAPTKQDDGSSYYYGNASRSPFSPEHRRPSADDVLQSYNKGYTNNSSSSSMYRQDSHSWGGEKLQGERTRKAIRQYSSEINVVTYNNDHSNNGRFRTDSELTAGMGGLQSQVVSDGSRPNSRNEQSHVTNDGKAQCGRCNSWYNYSSGCSNCLPYAQNWYSPAHSSPYSSMSGRQGRVVQTDDYYYTSSPSSNSGGMWMCDLCSNVNSSDLEVCGACQQGKK